MLDQREQRHRRRVLRARPAATSRANTPASVSGSAIAAGIVGLDVPARRARRRRGARARGPASPARRSCSRARPRAARPRSASASSSALAASITVMLSSAASRVAASMRSRPALGRARAAASPPRRAVRARRSRRARTTSSRAMPMRRSSACIASCGWPETGARPRARRPCSADQLPGRVVEIGVEPGQHHGAVRQRRDGGEQLRGRRHRAGRARRDHRAVVRREPLALGLDQQIAPRRRLDLAVALEQLAASARARSSGTRA